AVTALVLGGTAMLGWVVPSDALKRYLHEHHLAMNPMTAVCFICSGVALLLAREQSRTPGRDVGRVVFSGIAVLITLLKVLYGLPKYIAMAVNTAVGISVMSLGVLCVRPTRQPMALLVSSTAGGVVARRLVPVAVLVPLLIGWARLEAERRGYVESAVGVLL